MLWVVCRYSAIRPFLCIRLSLSLRKCSKKVVRKVLYDRRRRPFYVSPREFHALMRASVAVRTLLSSFFSVSFLYIETTHKRCKRASNLNFPDIQPTLEGNKPSATLKSLFPSHNFDRSLDPARSRKELMNAKCEGNEWIGCRTEGCEHAKDH